MKLLYFSCLFAVEAEKNNVKTYRKTPFGVLDKWMAYANGPVEDSVYSVIGYRPMPTISYDSRQDDGKKYSKNKKEISENIKKYYEIAPEDEINGNNILEKLAVKFGVEDKKHQIEKGFENFIRVISKINPTAPKNLRLLSNLSHMTLWNTALNRDAKLLATNNIYLLDEEYKEFTEKTSRYKNKKNKT